jgi:hypothetical protein
MMKQLTLNGWISWLMFCCKHPGMDRVSMVINKWDTYLSLELPDIEVKCSLQLQQQLSDILGSKP